MWKNKSHVPNHQPLFGSVVLDDGEKRIPRVPEIDGKLMKTGTDAMLPAGKGMRATGQPGTGKVMVGGAITILKNMKVSWEGFSHILWTIKFMFETTNQL